jgi:hypothetical protein
MDKIKRIKELVNLLNKACDAYYNLNNPIMENREYNLLFDELEELEKDIGVILADSPTQRAGYHVVSELPKIKHDIPLLSLGKRKKISDLEEWLGNNEGILMLKLDGGTGKVEYRNKVFYQLSTRGDSETNIGEDISHNVNSIKGIPLTINDDNDIQGVNELYTEAKYEANGMKLVGSMTKEDGFSVGKNEQIEFQTWAADATMSGVEAGVSHTTDLSENPTNKVTVKHSRQIAPAFTVTGNVELKSDKDGVVYKQPSLHDADVDQTYFNASNYAALQLDGKYTGVKKLTVEPKATLVKASEDHSYTRLGSKASYQVSPNGKLTAEYVNERINGEYNDSKLGANYEVKF